MILTESIWLQRFPVENICPKVILGCSPHRPAKSTDQISITFVFYGPLYGTVCHLLCTTTDCHSLNTSGWWLILSNSDEHHLAPLWRFGNSGCVHIHV